MAELFCHQQGSPCIQISLDCVSYIDVDWDV